MRDIYVINDTNIGKFDGKTVLKLVLEYTMKKATHFQTDFSKTAKKMPLSKNDATRILKDYLDYKVENIAFYDKEGSLLESYTYGDNFFLNLSKEEYAELQNMFEKKGVPKNMFYSQNDIGIRRRRMFGLVTQTKKSDK